MSRRLAIAAAVCWLLASTGSLAQEAAHFHHVRLNVTNIQQSQRFYARVFGAVPIRFRGSEALFTERSLILFNKVEQPPPSDLKSSIWHIGWGGVDVKNEFEWWKGHGVEIDTPLSPLPGQDNFYFYLRGPDKELIEINTMGHHRFAHVHLLATDVNETVGWYAKHLGLTPQRPLPVPDPMGDMQTLRTIWMNSFRCDNVTLIVFGKPNREQPPWWRGEPLREIAPTRGRAIDHLAFSYREIEPVFRRMQAAGVKIEQPIAVQQPLKLKSFFVLAPDNVLVEIVEAKPIPEGAWDE
jgi:catechol 2,3-dioxygenase-like lactoylglutathione lyase family enzyme